MPLSSFNRYSSRAQSRTREASDYPQEILNTFLVQDFFKNRRPDLLARMMDSNFDHLQAAIMVGRVLEVNDNDMESYAKFGEMIIKDD